MSSERSEATLRRDDEQDLEAQGGLKHLLALYRASALVAEAETGKSRQFTAKILEEAVRNRFALPD